MVFWRVVRLRTNFMVCKQKVFVNQHIWEVPLSIDVLSKYLKFSYIRINFVSILV